MAELKEMQVRLPKALFDEMERLAECCGLTGDQMCSATFVLQMRRVGDLNFPSDSPAVEPPLEVRNELARKGLCAWCGGETHPDTAQCSKCADKVQMALEASEEQVTHYRKALETIRDGFWSENEPHEERVEQLQRIAREVLVAHP